jgi:RNA polymerase-binding transcription factor DksA
MTTALERIFDRTGGVCHLCGDAIKFENRGWAVVMNGHWEADHVVQLKKDGSKDESNLLPACTRCNRLRLGSSGRSLQEILFLGRLVRSEIKKKTPLGRKLADLKAKRVWENHAKRMRKSIQKELKAGLMTADQAKQARRELRIQGRLTKREEQEELIPPPS